MKVRSKIPRKNESQQSSERLDAKRRQLLKSASAAIAAALSASGFAPALSSAADTSATSSHGKLMFVLFRRSDVSHEQCMAEWSGEPHVSIVKKIPGLRAWVQNHNSATNEQTPDGIGELWFDTPEAMADAMKSPEMGAAGEDAKRFLDMKRTYAVVVAEKKIVS